MTISLLPQYLVNGILAGMIYAVFTSGYSLIFATSRFMHIANGGILSLCGMLTWYPRECPSPQPFLSAWRPPC